MKLPQSKSDILRKIIFKAIDDGVDLSTTAQRNEFLQEYLESHPYFLCHRTLFVKICKQCHKDRNIDLHTVRLSRKKKYNVKLAEKLKQEHKERTESVISEQIPAVPQQLQPEELVQEINNGNLSVKFTESLFRGYLAPLEAIYPEIQLSDETYEQLGKMWHASIEKCDSDLLKFIILPTLSAMTLLGTKISTGRSIKKEKNSQSKNN